MNTQPLVNEVSKKILEQKKKKIEEGGQDM